MEYTINGKIEKLEQHTSKKGNQYCTAIISNKPGRGIQVCDMRGNFAPYDVGDTVTVHGTLTEGLKPYYRASLMVDEVTCIQRAELFEGNSNPMNL